MTVRDEVFEKGLSLRREMFGPGSARAWTARHGAS
jgi:hypothetical protein